MRIVNVFSAILTATLFCSSLVHAGAFKFRNTPGDMRWVNGRVPYAFKPEVGNESRMIFLRCIRAWQRFGNLRFVPTTYDFFNNSPDGDYLQVQHNDLRFFDLVKDVNYAWIGRSGGMQPMSIHNWSDEVVVHEMGHTLGFIHEQMRTDRDQFVQLNWDLINGFTTINFNIENNSVNRTDYDYDSIMHYSSTAFIDDWKTGDTIVATQNPEKTHTMGLSSWYPPHEEEIEQGPIGAITAMLSDGDRMAIAAEYGRPTSVKGIVRLPNNMPLKGVHATLRAVGNNNDEDAFIDLLIATGDRARTTDQNGEFIFYGIPSGDYKVTLSKNGYSFSEEYHFSGAQAPYDLVREFTATNSETVPPEVTLGYPVDGKSYKSLAALEGTASDLGGAGLEHIQFRLKRGNSWFAWTTPDSGEFDPENAPFTAANVITFPNITPPNWGLSSGFINPLADGHYRLEIRGRDFSGNTSEWVGADFTIDNDAPQITLDAPARQPFFDFETLPVGGTVSDTLDTQPKVLFQIAKTVGPSTYYWNGHDWGIYSFDPATRFTASITAGRWKPQSVGDLPPRSALITGVTYNVIVMATDAALNTRTQTGPALTRSIPDPSFPEIAITSFADGERYAEHAMPILRGTASDEESFIRGVRVYLMRLVPGENGDPATYKYWSGEEWFDASNDPDKQAHLQSEYDPATQTWIAPGLDYRLPEGAAELPGGTYKVQVAAFNRESPQATKLIEQTFYIATNTPKISITTPTHNGFVKSGWSLSGTVQDRSDSGFQNDRIDFTLVRISDGKHWSGSHWVTGDPVLHATIQSDNSWTYPGDDPDASLPMEEDTYAVSASVTDLTGNVSIPVAGGLAGNNQILFKVDTTPPECTIVGPSENTVITTHDLPASTFHGTAADASGQPEMFLFVKRLSTDDFWSGQYWTSDATQAALSNAYPGGGSSDAWVLTKDFPCINQYYWGMPNGTYELIAIARDAAGNETQRSRNLVIDYNPEWLRPQDKLARLLPKQTAPVSTEGIAGTLVQTATPWLEGYPGNGSNLQPIGFETDSQGNYYLINTVEATLGGSITYSDAIIQRLGANGWRRQRSTYSETTGSGENQVTHYYERWSEDTPAIEISSLEAGVKAAVQASHTDADGNTYAAFQLLYYDAYSSTYRTRVIDRVLVIKFDATGSVVWRTCTPALNLHQRSSVRHMNVLTDGSVSLVLENINEYTYVENYRSRTVVLRLNATGGLSGSANFGYDSNYELGTPYMLSSIDDATVDAQGATVLLTRESVQNEGFSRQVLRRINSAGQVLASRETSLCDTPETWMRVLADDTNGVYVVSSFDVSQNDGRIALTKYSTDNLSQLWRAFGPEKAFIPGNGEFLNCDVHIGPHSITLYRAARGISGTEFTREHPEILRFSLSGDLLWMRGISGDYQGFATNGDYLSFVEVTPDGDVLYLGYFADGTTFPQAIYGKISNAGDLQFNRPVTEESFVDTYSSPRKSTLTPTGELAALYGAYLSGEQRVRVFGNPASVTIPIVLDAPEPADQTVLVGQPLELKVINRGSAATYQWRKENAQGVPQNIQDATLPFLNIAEAALEDSGNYSCVVSNNGGTVTSRTAKITVLQPVDMDIALDTPGRTWTTSSEKPWYGFANSSSSHDGEDAATSAEVDYGHATWMETTVEGPATISFWRKVEMQDWQDRFYVYVDNLGDEESERTELTDYYSVDWTRQTITIDEPGTHKIQWYFYRSGGSSQSAHRVLLDQVVINSGTIALPEALDSTLTFTTGGAAAWRGVSSPAHDNVDAAMSGSISNNQESWVETTVEGPGTVSFWWKVSSESFDHLRLKIDGVNAHSISGEQDWVQVNYPVTGSGSHTIRWTYVKDAIGTFGDDRGWLDSVSFTPGSSGGNEPPAFTTTIAQLSKLRPTGASVAFIPVVTGQDPLTFQWQKAGKNIKDATHASFGLSNVKTTDAAVYSVKATNNYGNDTLTGYLGVAAAVPAAISVNEGGVLSLSCSATVPKGCSIDQYLWLKNGYPIASSPNYVITGSDLKALKITGVTPALQGSYTCQMRMRLPGDAGVVYGSTGETVVTVIEKPVIESLDLDDAYVSETVDIPVVVTKNPTKVSVSGLPPGVTFDAVTRKIKGKATAPNKMVKGVSTPYQVKITASNAAGSVTSPAFAWNILALDAAVIGSYNGLVARNVSLNGATGGTTGLGGTVKVTVATTGALSGTLKLGALSYSFKGALDTSSSSDPSAEITIVRKAPLTNLLLPLLIGPNNGVLSGSVIGNEQTAAIDGCKAVASAAYEGLYNNALIPPSQIFSNIAYPHGTGYATLKVSKTGSVTWGGKLADGSSITGSFPIGPSGQLPLHANLYSNIGSVMGWVTFSLPNRYVDGSLDWFKAPQVKTRSYQSGFSLHTLTVTGSLYDAKNITLHAILQGEESGPLTMELSHGGLAASLYPSITVLAPNTVTVPANDVALAVKIAPATGLITGSFNQAGVTAKSPRKVPLFGVVIPRLGTGQGYFLLPELPEPPFTTAGTSAINSGSFLISKGSE